MARMLRSEFALASVGVCWSDLHSFLVDLALKSFPLTKISYFLKSRAGSRFFERVRVDEHKYILG